MNQTDIKRHYQALLAHCERQRGKLPDHLLDFSRQWAQGLFNDYGALIDAIPGGVADRSVLDFGCKYGHLIPLLLARGASEAFGLDAEDDYVWAGKAAFESMYPNARILKTEDGYMPLQPASVDVVIMNEVISHVNPGFLDTVWREAARILRAGGVLFISDGNNLANHQARAKLVELYDKWENGPEGAKTDRDVVMDNFIKLRKDLIRARHPNLSPDKVEYVASNTSGLFGVYFSRVVERYVETGELIRRPYVRGLCPVNPRDSGVVMERAFFPQQLELALVEYGFAARQLVPKPVLGRRGMLGPAKDAYVLIRHYARRLARPHWHRSAY